MESIVTTTKECYYCGKTEVEKHHCWHGTANRKLAEKDGLFVWLCHDHHMRLHDRGDHDRELMMAAEAAWIVHNHSTIEAFVRRYGKNVL